MIDSKNETTSQLQLFLNLIDQGILSLSLETEEEIIEELKTREVTKAFFADLQKNLP